ncbi:hypothetical protein BJX63DRAFT_303957 [Aspergillus granulosus]|uniref:Major facilitator superfamily (MFS) profile domain-containing protein n=1 Tax=Aspergillus granulosus TaxID=176169 RepID=A0ABR4H5M5_9EURO
MSPPGLSPAQRRLILLVCASVVAADFGSALALAPQISIFESLICRRMGGGTDCKSPEVQGELALLTGWKETADQLAGIALALPYGLAADLFGRRPILLLALTGLLLEDVAIRVVCWWNAVLLLRMIWVSPAVQMIGGGSQIATAMAYAIITDVVPAQKRASVFYIIAAAILLGEILATPISAFLMVWSPWLPSLLSTLFELLGLFGAVFILEMDRTASELETPCSRNNMERHDEGEGESKEDNPSPEHNLDDEYANTPKRAYRSWWKGSTKRYWTRIGYHISVSN